MIQQQTDEPILRPLHCAHQRRQPSHMRLRIHIRLLATRASWACLQQHVSHILAPHRCCQHQWREALLCAKEQHNNEIKTKRRANTKSQKLNKTEVKEYKLQRTHQVSAFRRAARLHAQKRHKRSRSTSARPQQCVPSLLHTSNKRGQQTTKNEITHNEEEPERREADLVDDGEGGMVLHQQSRH